VSRECERKGEDAARYHRDWGHDHREMMDRARYGSMMDDCAQDYARGYEREQRHQEDMRREEEEREARNRADQRRHDEQREMERRWEYEREQEAARVEEEQMPEEPQP